MTLDDFQKILEKYEVSELRVTRPSGKWAVNGKPKKMNRFQVEEIDLITTVKSFIKKMEETLG